MVLSGGSSTPLSGLWEWSQGAFLVVIVPGMLLAVRCQWPGMLLTSCNANSPPTLENHPPPNVNSALMNEA